MYTKTKRYKAAILLLPIILTMRIGVYGRSTADRSEDRAEQKIDTGHKTQDTRRDRASSIQYPVSRIEFGRENPFMPLIVEHAIRSVVKPDKPDSRRAGLLDVRLTAIFVGDASYAIIEEEGISRCVYVGDTVAGMKVLEIRRGEVILSKGDKRQAIILGVLSEAMEGSEL